MTFAEKLAERAATLPDQRAFTFLGDGENETSTLTYRALYEGALGVAHRLLAAGLVPGDRALLVFAPGLDFISGFFGCLLSGVVAVPSYPPDPGRLDRTLPRLIGIAKGCAPKAVLTTAFVRDAGAALAASALSAIPWLAVDEIAASTDALPLPAPDQLAFLQYTSGSTAAPKGVMVTHANLIANSTDIFASEENHLGSRSLTWLPTFHDMGLVDGVLQPIWGGFPAYMMPPAAFLQRPARWLEAITRYQITNSGGPNFGYALCVRKVTEEERARLDLRSWRIAYNGAEPVRWQTIAQFSHRFAGVGFSAGAMAPVYGMAEATLFVSGPRMGEAPQLFRDVVSCGKVKPSLRCLIVDPETALVQPDGALGEICLSGASVARGYFADPARTAQSFGAEVPGFGTHFRTGDLGFMHEGELYVTGRLKDMVIVRGRNIVPSDVEVTVEGAHDAVRAGCVVAFSVVAEGTEALAIAAEVDASADASAVIAAIRHDVAWKHDVAAVAVSLLLPRTLPKTSSGKLRRQATKNAFFDGTLALVAEDRLAAILPPQRPLVLAWRTRVDVAGRVEEVIARVPELQRVHYPREDLPAVADDDMTSELPVPERGLRVRKSGDFWLVSFPHGAPSDVERVLGMLADGGRAVSSLGEPLGETPFARVEQVVGEWIARIYPEGAPAFAVVRHSTCGPFVPVGISVSPFGITVGVDEVCRRFDVCYRGVEQEVATHWTRCLVRMLRGEEWVAPGSEARSGGSLRGSGSSGSGSGSGSGSSASASASLRGSLSLRASAEFHSGEHEISGAELDAWVDGVAGALPRGELIGVKCEPGFALYAAVVGVWRAGSTVLLLHPEYPEAYLGQILAVARPGLVIDEKAIAALPRSGEAGDVPLAERAYVHATQGADGPVLVEGTHAQLALAAEAWLSLVQEHAGAAVAMRAPTWSVHALVEIAATWGAGGRVYVAEPADQRCPAALGARLFEHEVSGLSFASSQMRHQLAAMLDLDERFAHYRRIVLRSEIADAAMLARLKKRAPQAEVTQMYSVAELGGPVATRTSRTSRWEPLPHLHVHVRDADGALVPFGVRGEMHVGTVRTGDRGRLFPDGTFTLEDRTDTQVKSFGFRVVRAHVEAVLKTLPGVRDALVTSYLDPRSETRLAAYVVGDAKPEALRRALRRIEPEQALPASFHLVDEIPKDRSALPPPPYLAPAQMSEPPATEMERRLAAIWSDVLRIPHIGRDQSFFALGGDSFLGLQVTHAAVAQGIALVPAMISQHQTVRKLAAALA